jgi:hypothetical protein
MNKYFKTDSVTYETIRDNMDKASGYPSNEAETWFALVTDAPMDEQGNVLIAAMPEIAEEFIKAGATEISEEEFQSIFPEQENALNI